MKRIMVIAGGTWQVPLIKKIKNLGYEVVNSNLYTNSVGFESADFYGVMDVRDKVKNLKLAQKYNVDAVLTDQSDIAIPTVAYVAEKIGCPGIGEGMAELFTNKFKMREFCKKNNFKYPEYRLCKTVDEAIDFMNTLKGKIIIKPLDSQSSRGIFTIETDEDMKQKFPIAQSFSNSCDCVLAERYIAGTEFTIDGIVINGKHHSLAISQKSHFSFNKNIASKLFFSYYNENFDYEILRQLDNKIIEKTGIGFALTHSEYKYENGEYYLIEMAARGGGTKISSDIVPYMSGIDNYKLLIEAALGELSTKDSLDFSLKENLRNRCALLEFLDVESKGKKITSIEGVDEIKAIPELLEFQLEFKVGDIVEQAQDDRTRAGFFIICAESAEKIYEIEDRIKNTLVITFEE